MEEAGPSTVDLLAAITSCKETLTTTDISLTRHVMDKYRIQLKEAKSTIAQVKDVVQTDCRDLHALQSQVKALYEKTVDIEN